MRIQWTARALDDRKDIFDYIEEDSRQSAIEVDDRIESQVKRLIVTPEIGRTGRTPGTREFVINRTPYIAAYRIDGQVVRILRVLHGAREWPDDLTYD
jgi:addiction module RelE/StbE family toxin